MYFDAGMGPGTPQMARVILGAGALAASIAAGLCAQALGGGRRLLIAIP